MTTTAVSGFSSATNADYIGCQTAVRQKKLRDDILRNPGHPCAVPLQKWLLTRLETRAVEDIMADQAALALPLGMPAKTARASACSLRPVRQAARPTCRRLMRHSVCWQGETVRGLSHQATRTMIYFAQKAAVITSMKTLTAVGEPVAPYASPTKLARTEYSLNCKFWILTMASITKHFIFGFLVFSWKYFL